MSEPLEYTLRFWDHFDDMESETIAKGWTRLIQVDVDQITYDLEFFDPARLEQEIRDGFRRGEPYFNEENLIVVEQVDRAHITVAVAGLSRAGFRSLKPSSA